MADADPAHKALERAEQRAMRIEDKAQIDLANTAPQSREGLLALLSYVEDFCVGAQAMPGDERNWHSGTIFLHDIEDRKSLDRFKNEPLELPFLFWIIRSARQTIAGHAAEMAPSSSVQSSAPNSNSAERKLIEIEAKLRKCLSQAKVAGDVHTEAEKVELARKRKNPEPPKSNKKAHGAWARRRAVAERELSKKEKPFVELLDQAMSLCVKASKIRTVTVEGLKGKARIVALDDGNDDVLGSIADDLLRLGEAHTKRKGVDPIFAAIDKHRRLVAAQEDAIRRHSKLEKDLPGKMRQTHVAGGSIVETDDPKWIASEQEVYDGWDAVYAAAIAMVDVRPTTLAGTASVLRYVAATMEGEDMGVWLPTNLFDDDDPKVDKEFGMPFGYFVHRNAAEAIEQITAAA
jgi:hypothetical protein